MSSTGFDADLAANDDEWLSGALEHQFFNQARGSHPDLDWSPATPMAPESRRAMVASLGMLAVSIVGLSIFVLYTKVIMPAPEPVGLEGPVLQPSAAFDANR
jgi:hypothetical protein